MSVHYVLELYVGGLLLTYSQRQQHTVHIVAYSMTKKWPSTVDVGKDSFSQLFAFAPLTIKDEYLLPEG